MSVKVILLFIICSCSMVKTPEQKISKDNEFSQGEVLIANQLLTKIYDGEMATLECVPDREESGLLLRTINPRMDMIQDDLEALLDDPKEINKLIDSCEKDCSCGLVDELIREHLVTLDKKQKAKLEAKRKEKDLKTCLNYAKETFCTSELFKVLNKEKVDFTYEEDAP